jgi:hypothetical protein
MMMCTAMAWVNTRTALYETFAASDKSAILTKLR